MSDYVFCIVLAILAAFIWLRNPSWASSSGDTLPILAAIPLFFWMGAPWSIRSEAPSFSPSLIALSAFLYLLGIAFDLTLALALGWTALLWCWVSARAELDQVKPIRRLLVLPVLAFPWIFFDANSIGWWFRLSSAWATSQLFSLAGFNVVQEGTNILINNLPISIEAACAGLNTLQSMLIAGIIVDYLVISSPLLYWLNIPLLVAMAWVTNTLRIIVICISALAVGVEFAMGYFHMLGGWLVIVFMFGFCLGIFLLEEKLFCSKEAG